MSKLHIGFQANFEDSNEVSIVEEGFMPEHENIWVWDHYYAIILHELADSKHAELLRDTLEGWAGSIISDIMQPAAVLHKKNYTTVDTKLTLSGTIDESISEAYVIDVESNPTQWPTVRTQFSVDKSPNRMAYSVIALAQFMLKKNDLFIKELPMHILSIRKFFEDGRELSDENIIAEAPVYAINKAMKFFEDMKAKKITQH